MGYWKTKSLCEEKKSILSMNDYIIYYAIINLLNIILGINLI